MVLCFLLVVVGLVSCDAGQPVHNQSDVDSLRMMSDSVQVLNAKMLRMASTYSHCISTFEFQIQEQNDSLMILRDSLIKLNDRPLMTKKQFLDLYKYERLYKYYRICKNNPTQWKYYRGWSTRVFED